MKNQLFEAPYTWCVAVRMLHQEVSKFGRCRGRCWGVGGDASVVGRSLWFHSRREEKNLISGGGYVDICCVTSDRYTNSRESIIDMCFRFRKPTKGLLTNFVNEGFKECHTAVAAGLKNLRFCSKLRLLIDVEWYKLRTFVLAVMNFGFFYPTVDEPMHEYFHVNIQIFIQITL
jgi:hypothetical protein